MPIMSSVSRCRRFFSSKIADGPLKAKRHAMLAPVIERLIPVLIQAAQFPDDFNEWEKDKQEDFRRVFRCVQQPSLQ